MKTFLRVSVGEEFGQEFVYVKEIQPRLMRILEPMRVCDDSVLGPLVGAITSDCARIVTVKRKDYAKMLSAEITTAIMEYIERNDTVNGYKVKEQA